MDRAARQHQERTIPRGSLQCPLPLQRGRQTGLRHHTRHRAAGTAQPAAGHLQPRAAQQDWCRIWRLCAQRWAVALTNPGPGARARAASRLQRATEQFVPQQVLRPVVSARIPAGAQGI